MWSHECDDNSEAEADISESDEDEAPSMRVCLKKPLYPSAPIVITTWLINALYGDLLTILCVS